MNAPMQSAARQVIGAFDAGGRNGDIARLDLKLIGAEPNGPVIPMHVEGMGGRAIYKIEVLLIQRKAPRNAQRGNDVNWPINQRRRHMR